MNLHREALSFKMRRGGWELAKVIEKEEARNQL
jgi:hypothetical protein